MRAAEQGRAEGGLDALEPHNRHALNTLRETVDAHPKDWPALHRHAVEFHLRNARAWADEATGLDLAAQIDPDFVPGPTALA